MQSNIDTYSSASYTDELLQKVEALSDDEINDLFSTSDSEEYEPQFGLLDLALSITGYAGCKPVGDAAIATTLQPEVDSFLAEGSAMYIVGNDGPNISKKNYPWRKMLCEWLERGVDIHYLLISPTQEAIDTLAEIKAEYKDKNSGSMLAWKAINSHEEQPRSSDSAWIKRLKTTHFVAFERPSMLWLEANHSPESTEANGCVFYDRDSEFGATVGNTLIDQFGTLTNNTQLTERIV